MSIRDWKQLSHTTSHRERRAFHIALAIAGFFVLILLAIALIGL
jgi:hypothetical protein